MPSSTAVGAPGRLVWSAVVLVVRSGEEREEVEEDEVVEEEQEDEEEAAVEESFLAPALVTATISAMVLSNCSVAFYCLVRPRLSREVKNVVVVVELRVVGVALV